MPTIDVTIVGKLTTPEIGGGPIIPPGTPGQPPGIWGGPGSLPPVAVPPIYIPIPPPEGGEHPELPIYIPVFPAFPIVIPLPPLPPTDAHPEHPIVLPPIVWPPLPERPPSGGGGPVDPGWGIPGPPYGPVHIWGGGPHAEPPIYYPVPVPPDPDSPPGTPTHPIYFPIAPEHPIFLPPGEEKPPLPPAMVNPPSSQPGFWGYSPGYGTMVFVPYSGAGPEVPTGGGRRG